MADGLVPLVVVHGATAAAEYGAVVVSSNPVVGERTMDCVCCQSRLDVVDALAWVLDRKHRPDCVHLHLHDSDDAATVVRTLLSDPDLDRLVDLHAVVAHVNGPRAATRLAVGLPVLDEPGIVAAAICDALVIDERSAVTEPALVDLDRHLMRAAPYARARAASDVDPRRSAGRWHGAPDLAARGPQIVDGDVPSLVVCQAEERLDAEAVDDWLERLIAQHATRLLRMQGALSVAGRAHRVCCRGVRSHIDHHDEGSAGHVRSTESLVAIVGYGLDAEELTSGFQAARS